MSKMIYLDNAATTRTAPEVVEAMLPYFSELYGNPSSIYDLAGRSKEGVTAAREQIAGILGAKKEEAVYVGDSDVDVATAAAAGLPCLSVLWGFRDRAFIEAHGATCFVENPSDILKLLKDL